MILVAGGDSFVWGQELADCRHSGLGGNSQKTFPALLSQSKNLDYTCCAFPGNANNAISRKTILACEELNSSQFIVTVNWTFTQRYEFRFNYNTLKNSSPWYSMHSHYPNEDAFSKMENAGLLTEFIKVFYKHVGNSECYELYTTLKEILFLQMYLKSKNIPYLFTTADNSYYEHENYLRSKDVNLEVLYNQIDWGNWYFFPPGTGPDQTEAPRGFFQWAAENKYSRGSDGHPLEQAHADAAELIKDKFNELVTKSI
jgi:hypothetical protein